MENAQTGVAISETSPLRRGLLEFPKVNGHVAYMENVGLLEELYASWKKNPQSIEPSWRAFFEGFELGCQLQPTQKSKTATTTQPADKEYWLKQARVYKMLFAYRIRGHMKADIDPLRLSPKDVEHLRLSHFQLTDADLNTRFDSSTLAHGGERTLREIQGILEETYCGRIGVEYVHIQDFVIRRWLRDRMEVARNKPNFSKEKKMRILNRILSSELFERFLHTRYVGQKRFSLEGGETLIPMLDAIVENAPAHGIEQLVMGMAHRGRLNVLANILGKSYHSIFEEFADNYIPETVQGDGDVRYHVGYESTVQTSNGENVVISLAPNASHLEAVDSVVQGKARARQRNLNDTIERRKVLPILIHGDAAFMGQGIVAETFNLARLKGYRTGGTVHIVINNQIGFTTLPTESRSSFYCTGLARGFDIPVFHVNGDDPLAAVYVIELALNFRQRFGQDVIIDLVCYRRHGHNEGDEPAITQPQLYSVIENHPPVSHVFSNALIKAGVLDKEEVVEHKQKYTKLLQQELERSQERLSQVVPAIRKPLSCPKLLDPVQTDVPLETLKKIGGAITTFPSEININSKVQKVLENRRAMIEGQKPLDWACAEALCFGSLLVQGIPVRLSGQDSQRGTFNHRHAALYDIKTQQSYLPLQNISPQQATFCAYNSPLSEAAVLGFDYGYSLNTPNMLILWEAQFGDFSNGAQVIIDQYITSAESKWGSVSRIVLLLPHGYQGLGPEHSSARIERFLQACAEDNIQVANCTTPASYFHILRRQGLRSLRKPLVIFTPKGLLRDPRATSSIEELANGQFQEIIPDPHIQNARKIILCSGKIYHDLVEYRRNAKIDDTAVIRIEQLYPLHTEKLRAAIAAHPNAQKFVWCQEESRNMGAWTFMEPRFHAIFNRDFIYAGRDASASPATGSLAIHQLEQRDVLQQAFGA